MIFHYALNSQDLARIRAQKRPPPITGNDRQMYYSNMEIKDYISL